MKKPFLPFFLLFIIASLPFAVERNMAGVWITSSDLLIVCALLMGCVKTIRERSFKRMSFPVIYLTGGFLLMLGLSAAVALNRFDAVRELAKYFMTFSFFYLLVNEIGNERVLETVPRIIFATSVVLSAWFLRDFFVKAMPYHYIKLWMRPPFSQMHFNTIGAFVALAIPFGLHLIFESRRPLIKIMLVGGMFANLAALVFSYSRLNWLATALIILVIFISRYRVKGLLIGILFLTIPVALILRMYPGYKVQERFLSTFHANEGSQLEREIFAAAALKLIKLRPVLGVGTGNFKSASRKYLGEDVNEMVHNVYLQYWAEAGLLAMLLFIALILKYYFDVRDLMPALATGRQQQLLTYAMLSFSALVLVNQFGDPFVRGLKEYFALLMSLPYAIKRNAIREENG